MQGRYGVLDTLGKVLLVLGLVLAFFAPVFSGDHVIGMVFYLLGCNHAADSICGD